MREKERERERERERVTQVRGKDDKNVIGLNAVFL